LLVGDVLNNNSTPYYYHQDQLGSIRALTNGSGSVANTYSYDAYGNTTSSTGTVYNPFGYAGEYTDSESGFVYLRARYYDPATQQFLSVDPWVRKTGQAYGYSGADPVNFVDPLGLSRHLTQERAKAAIELLFQAAEQLDPLAAATDAAGDSMERTLTDASQDKAFNQAYNPLEEMAPPWLQRVVWPLGIGGMFGSDINGMKVGEIANSLRGLAKAIREQNGECGITISYQEYGGVTNSEDKWVVTGSNGHSNRGGSFWMRQYVEANMPDIMDPWQALPGDYPDRGTLIDAISQPNYDKFISNIH